MPPTTPPDALETLIQRCLQGDQAAWEAIVRQHWRKVFNVAYKFVGKHDEAEDLDAGHLPQDLQVARHVRSARELPDLADQRQPQPVHRSLPQRPQGARDDRPRRGRRASWRPRRPSQARWPALEQRDRVDAAAAGAGGAARDAADRRADARHPGAVVPGDRRRLRLPEGTVKSRINRGRTELARQIRKLRGDDYSPGGQSPTPDRARERTDERDNRTVRRRRDRPRRRDAADVPDARRLRRRAVTGLIAGGQRDILIDLTPVTYVDSATIGCLMDLYRQVQRRRRPPEAVRRPEARRDDADDDRRAELHRDPCRRAERRQELRGLACAPSRPPPAPTIALDGDLLPSWRRSTGRSPPGGRSSDRSRTWSGRSST